MGGVRIRHGQIFFVILAAISLSYAHVQVARTAALVLGFCSTRTTEHHDVFKRIVKGGQKSRVESGESIPLTTNIDCGDRHSLDINIIHKGLLTQAR
jgi:hypothetical protein